MKNIFVLVTLCALIALSYFALKPSTEDNPEFTQQLPWQIEQLNEGGTRIFGIRPGQTRVIEALSILGEDHDLAIIIDQADKAGLEIYYSHFKAGPLAGKLILSVNTTTVDLEAMAEDANKADFMASGARKFELNRKDLNSIQTLSIKGISFLPSASLSREIIEQRFGKAEKEFMVDKDLYFLYPKLGLSITLNDKTKEVLQYVHPDDFASLRAPLETRVKTTLEQRP